MKPASARHRTDTGSAALIELLLASGIGYVPLGGAIDGCAYSHGLTVLVDWKQKPTSKLTKTQHKLTARNVPIWFLATDADVLRLVQWMRAVLARVEMLRSGLTLRESQEP